MQQYLFLIPVLPLAGFLLLALAGKTMSKRAIAFTGTGSVCVAALIAILLCTDYLSGNSGNAVYIQSLWQWFQTAELAVGLTLRVDALSLVFIFIITFVGALIHVFASAYMRADRDYARFFACMNLFVASMLVLVMADNLVLLYLGWEGVGMCSYLLIGFWYETAANCRAANKAFIITRIGDTALIIGIFLLFRELGSLQIPAILDQAPQRFSSGSGAITTIALLLLAGGMGKSAQVPLQTWLPDAMAGPTPVSALIHAATMVTAGVYLIARMHTIFLLSPLAMTVTAAIGSITLIVAGCSAMVQTDIKRILAYSTISQIGYMFLALGVGAWSAAIFHFFTHAFFKALLFLAAGVVIEYLHHEQDIFRMGGLKKQLPLVYYCFLAGAGSLAAVPLISAGFYSKDAILWYAYSAAGGNAIFWIAGLVGAFITAFYSARLVVVVFWGDRKTPVGSPPGRTMTIPLVILAFLSITAGFIEWPHNLLNVHLFSEWLGTVLPATSLRGGHPPEFILQIVAVVITLSGICTGYYLYFRNTAVLAQWKSSRFPAAAREFFFSGWKFDALYNHLVVRPFLFLTGINKRDVFDRLSDGIVTFSKQFNRSLSFSQNGSLRWYVAGVLIGILFIITIQLIL
ncbi:NADH-quinone oxidoreductase subunit L [Flavihumibacter petaseus]|uniref:NADH--quinone oxidoreductase subunit L n=1 Tax=Flavihumibacter petaseus NBRC 106054 TaxID=1220578 RepID=A0A0E9MU74_9BACT|nr:NADH-quinone oxidoreductase subunit L [Flavihumibacter petaseus]GAO41119.1 NADH--quinone oxidoreductase subunit L [Flavihumibacter petaseus NBRC 106054]